jgi:hypothetical protein
MVMMMMRSFLIRNLKFKKCHAAKNDNIGLLCGHFLLALSIFAVGNLVESKQRGEKSVPFWFYLKNTQLN